MESDNKKWNYSRQFKVFGIGLIIAIVIALILVLTTNAISKKISDNGIW